MQNASFVHGAVAQREHRMYSPEVGVSMTPSPTMHHGTVTQQQSATRVERGSCECNSRRSLYVHDFAVAIAELRLRVTT